MSTVLYPGSFDPFHYGHLDVVTQAAELFGNVVIGVMHNPQKPTGVLPASQRIELIESMVGGIAGVSVQSFGGLAVDAARTVHASCIVKGLRTPGDFEVEQQMAHTNFAVAGVRTVYVPCQPGLSHVSSRYIRDIVHYGGDVSSMVPAQVVAALQHVFSARS
jgi:pantetheine-phosphate adenylyltransferase